MEHARERATNEPLRLASNWAAATLFFGIWNATFGWIAWLLVNRLGSQDVKDVQWYIVGGFIALSTVAEVTWAVLQIRGEKRKNATAAAEIGSDEPLLQAAV
jgi:hypothetical protein